MQRTEEHVTGPHRNTSIRSTLGGYTTGETTKSLQQINGKDEEVRMERGREGGRERRVETTDWKRLKRHIWSFLQGIKTFMRQSGKCQHWLGMWDDHFSRCDNGIMAIIFFFKISLSFGKIHQNRYDWNITESKICQTTHWHIILFTLIYIGSFPE